MELEEFSPSLDKIRTAELVDGDSDTDFAVAVESGVDEDYRAPNLSTANPQVPLKKESRGAGRGGPMPSQIRQGMAKKKPLESHKFSEKISRGEKPAAAQKTTLSKATLQKSCISPSRLDDSKS